MIAKRLFDLLASAVGLLLLSPLLAVIAVMIKLDSPGPVFYRQERVGLHGRLFRIHKFRTMRVDADRTGPQLTIGADRRVTRVGDPLRRYKLDELPQLIDVLVGTMSLVGPRPEVPRYVAAYPDSQRELVLSVRPGITDWASILYRSENEVLARAAEPQRAYIEEVLPVKLRYYTDYVRQRSFWGDLRIIAATLVAVVRP